MRDISKTDIHRTVEAVWKIESIRLIAGIARVTHDIGITEELAQDVLAAALERWPKEGIPGEPCGVAEGGGADSLPVTRRRFVSVYMRTPRGPSVNHT